jgi:hypothetical protein
MAGGRMSGGDTAELVTVRLLGLPLRVHARAQQQAESMQREFQLIVEQAREDAGSVPGRLLELSTVLSARYEGFSEEQEERIEAATAANELQLTSSAGKASFSPWPLRLT